MTNLLKAAFYASFAAALAATLAFFAVPSLGVSFGWVTLAFVAATVFGAFHPGDKTRLQLMFLSLGILCASATAAFNFGWLGWVGTGICAFLVLTMKLDGGDGYGG